MGLKDLQGAEQSSYVHENTRKPSIDAGFIAVGRHNGTNSGQALDPLAPATSARMHRTHAAQLLGYVPAEAHFTDRLTYVDCYAVHPDTGALKRKRYKLNHIRSAVQRKAAARTLCARINARLAAGWSPWSAEEAPRSMDTIRAVLERWSKVKDRTRHSSPHNYRMQARMFSAWCAKRGMLDSPIGMFTKQHAYQYMDHIENERGVNGTTYNGYLALIRGFFRWAQAREYRSDNPFKMLERKRRPKKMRTILSAEERRQAMDWFAKHDPAMVPVLLFVFHTLIRPRNELARLKVEHVDLDNGVIRFPADDTKTYAERHPAMPASMVAVLREHGLHRADPRHYVVSTDLRPGAEQMNLNTPAIRWGRMRKALGWPREKQLMSLRDSGIVQLIRDHVPLESVMRQADHKNIATTNTYVQHAFPYAQKDVWEKASAF